MLDRPRRRSQADWDASTFNYPVGDTAEQWEKVLASSPDVMWQMIADILKVAKSHQGPSRSGRRPAAAGMSIDELWDTLYPVQYSLEPFPQALGSLITGTQREFAAAIPCTPALLCRLLSGERTPSTSVMEAISRVGNVPPTYFVEYRARRLGQLVTDILTANPLFSAELFKRWSQP